MSNHEVLLALWQQGQALRHSSWEFALPGVADL